MFNDSLKYINHTQLVVTGTIWLLLQYPLSRTFPEVYDAIALGTMVCCFVYFALTDWIWSVEAFISGLHPFGRRWLLLAHCDRFGVEPCDVTVFYNTTYQTAYSTRYCEGGEEIMVTGITYARIESRPQMTATAIGRGNTNRMVGFATTSSGYSASGAYVPPLPPPPVYVNENSTDITESLTRARHTGISANNREEFVYAVVRYTSDNKND